MDNTEQLLKELIKLVKKHNKLQRQRLDNMLKLGCVKLVKDGQTQKLQVKSANDEILDNVAFLEQYGLTCKPLPESETLLLSVQGNPFNQIALNVGSRELRFKALKSGEVCVYDNSGNKIHLQNGGKMELAAPESVTVITQTAKIKAKESVEVKTKTASIDAESVTTTGKTKLANGTIGVALLGCAVKVDPKTHEGTITSASTEVTAQ